MLTAHHIMTSSHRSKLAVGAELYLTGCATSPLAGSAGSYSEGPKGTTYLDMSARRPDQSAAEVWQIYLPYHIPGVPHVSAHVSGHVSGHVGGHVSNL
jgi:hypothetical protein